MSEFNDKVLGKLLYNGGWQKSDILVYGRKEIKIQITFLKEEDKKVSEKQVEAYKWFKHNIISILEESKEKLIKDYKCFEKDILEECRINKIPSDIFELIELEEVIITEKANIGILYLNMLGQEEAIIIDKDKKLSIQLPEEIWYDN